MSRFTEWDPDIILYLELLPYQPDDLYNNTIDGDDWSNVTAVTNQQVYKIPAGYVSCSRPHQHSAGTEMACHQDQPDTFQKIWIWIRRIKDYYEK